MGPASAHAFKGWSREAESRRNLLQLSKVAASAGPRIGAVVVQPAMSVGEKPCNTTDHSLLGIRLDEPTKQYKPFPSAWLNCQSRRIYPKHMTMFSNHRMNGPRVSGVIPFIISCVYIYTLMSVTTKDISLLHMYPLTGFSPLNHKRLNPISAPNPCSKPLHWSHC